MTSIRLSSCTHDIRPTSCRTRIIAGRSIFQPFFLMSFAIGPRQALWQPALLPPYHSGGGGDPPWPHLYTISLARLLPPPALALLLLVGIG